MHAVKSKEFLGPPEFGEFSRNIDDVIGQVRKSSRRSNFVMRTVFHRAKAHGDFRCAPDKKKPWHIVLPGTRCVGSYLFDLKRPSRVVVGATTFCGPQRSGERPCEATASGVSCLIGANCLEGLRGGLLDY